MFNKVAAEAVVAAMRSSGFIPAEAEARVVAFLSLAEAVDGDPSNAALWREYRAAESSVLDLRGDTDDDHSAFLRSRAAMVNSPN